MPQGPHRLPWDTGGAANRQRVLVRRAANIPESHGHQAQLHGSLQNGSVEGFHSYWLSALVNEQHSNWDEHIDAVLLAYRTAVIDGTGISPFEIVYGRPANLPLDNALAESKVWGDAPEDSETIEEYAADFWDE